MSVVDGFLQSGLVVVITLNTFPFDPEGHDQTHEYKSFIHDIFTQHITLLLNIDADDFGDGPFELTFDSEGVTQCELVPIRTDNLIENAEAFIIVITNIPSPPPLVNVAVDNVNIFIFDSTGTFYIH